MKFLIINGPNLNLMHFTEPGVAGQTMVTLFSAS